MYLDSGWQTFINFFQLHLSYIVYCVVCLSFIYFYFFWGGGVVLWLRICVEVAVDRISIHPPLSLFGFLFRPHPHILSLTQVTVI